MAFDRTQKFASDMGGVAADAIASELAKVYKPKKFVVQQLTEDVFQITYGGDPYRSYELLSDHILLRSAEVTLENEFQYFVIAEKSSVPDHYAAALSHTIQCYNEKPESGVIAVDAESVTKRIRQKYKLPSTGGGGSTAGAVVIGALKGIGQIIVVLLILIFLLYLVISTL